MTQTNKGSVLVTGASAGLGHAIAMLLDREGYRVFAGVRKPDDAARLSGEASALLVPVFIDVTDSRQIADTVAKMESVLGPDEGLAAVVNNAGIAVAGPLEFLSLDDIRRSLEVNIVGQIAVIKACLPLIRKGRGRIIQVTSGARNFGMPFMGAYAASKAGMGAVCDVLRREMRQWKIPVSEVLPGVVQTPMWEKYRKPADQLQSQMPGHAQAQADTFAKGRSMFERVAAMSMNTPESVAKTILRAVKARHPGTHYPAGLDACFALLLPRLVPPRILDWFVARALR